MTAVATHRPRSRTFDTLTSKRVMGMSLQKFVSLAGGLVVLAGAFAAVFRGLNGVETREHADSTFVHTSTFNAFQQGVAAQRSLDSATHILERYQDRQVILSLDSSDKCRRHIERYCR